ncbi:MAG: transposase [Bacteroidales bacterium]|nr:transposase [Bacteroidales bacterium]
MKNLEKMHRTFSSEFKKEKVLLIEQGKLTVSSVSKAYGVSRAAIYKWIHKYGLNYQKGERIVVEKISEEIKTKELQDKVVKLEQVIGQQQLQLIYKESVIKCASEHYGEDIEKKYDSRQ